MNLTEDQIDVLKELINVGFGDAASTLNDMLDAHVELQVPELKVLPISNLEDSGISATDEQSITYLNFKGNFQGHAALLFPPASAKTLVSTLLGESTTGPEMDAELAGVLKEVGNIVINSIVGTFSNAFHMEVIYDIPDYVCCPAREIFAKHGLSDDHEVIVAITNFKIQELSIVGVFYLLFNLESLTLLFEKLETLTSY